MKIAAFAWALVVATLARCWCLQLRRGIELQTDITALLPFEERDAFDSARQGSASPRS